MRRLGVLFALGACNRVFGVTPAVERDATVFDAPIDAPFHCPAIGEPLQFSSVIHQVLAQDCAEYGDSKDTGLAVAMCMDPETSNRWVYQGPVGQPMVRAPGLPPAVNMAFDSPRISPEGDLLVVTATVLGIASHPVYAAQPDGSWLQIDALPIPGIGNVTAPSRGPDRHLMYFDFSTTITEWSSDGTTWTPLPATVEATAAVNWVWFAPDGLRLVISVAAVNGGYSIEYAYRAALGDPFSSVMPLPTLPRGPDPYVSEDCSRAYVSSVGTLFYAQQL